MSVQFNLTLLTSFTLLSSFCPTVLRLARVRHAGKRTHRRVPWIEQSAAQLPALLRRHPHLIFRDRTAVQCDRPPAPATSDVADEARRGSGPPDGVRLLAAYLGRWGHLLAQLCRQLWNVMGPRGDGGIGQAFRLDRSAIIFRPQRISGVSTDRTSLCSRAFASCELGRRSPSRQSCRLSSSAPFLPTSLCAPILQINPH